MIECQWCIASACSRQLDVCMRFDNGVIIEHRRMG